MLTFTTKQKGKRFYILLVNDTYIHSYSSGAFVRRLIVFIVFIVLYGTAGLLADSLSMSLFSTLIRQSALHSPTQPFPPVLQPPSSTINSGPVKLSTGQILNIVSCLTPHHCTSIIYSLRVCLFPFFHLFRLYLGCFSQFKLQIA